MKVALCTIGKNENLYIKEWVEHYHNLGFDKIFLYDNNDKDGEHFEDVISDYIQSGFVKIIDYRGKKVCQMMAYDDCYQSNSKDYDYIAFFDCDELLTLYNHKTIQDFLTPLKKFDSVHINWVNAYNFKNYIHYSDLSLKERFPDIKNDKENHIKSIYKTNIRNFKWNSKKSGANPHCCKHINCTCCDSAGNSIPNDTPWFNTFKTNAVLVHYHFKSLEEFCDKIKRGFPDQIISFTEKYIKNQLNRFFLVYEYTSECEDVILSKFNLHYKKSN